MENETGDVLEEMLEAMYSRGEDWTDSWRIFITPRISRLIIPWDPDLLKEIRETCRSLKIIYVTKMNETFTAGIIQDLPDELHSLDFDGQLYFAGRTLPQPKSAESWLEEVSFWIRRLKTERLEPRQETGKLTSLTRLDLGSVATSSGELATVLQQCPAITYLRHYQLVSALVQLHMADWKDGGRTLPKYNLTNLDADFSHVVRCRMSPRAVLPVDALALCVALCPSVSSVRLRFDNSTSHHVVGPLLRLDKLQEFSAVCVSSGERVLLDFVDFAPILEHFGSSSLTELELKVVEEVDPHIILKRCPLLQGLTLSGCGYAHGSCSSGRAERCRPGPSLPCLRRFFFADGDDFSWDHALPQCFWISVLANSKKRRCKLEGLFLESPRMSEDTLNILLGDEGHFEALKSLCLRRWGELTSERILRLVSICPQLEYLRCEGLSAGSASAILRMRPGLKIKID